MAENKVFKEMDLLIGVKMHHINQGLSQVREFLNDRNIPLHTSTSSGEPIGQVLLSTLESINDFLVEYKEIKNTWQLTTV